MPRPLAIGRSFNLIFFAMKDCGDALTEEALKSEAVQQRVKTLVSKYHAAGYAHRDLAARNIVMDGETMRLVDVCYSHEITEESRVADLADIAIMING